MSYKQFLETQIHQLYSFICEHQRIIQTTSRPEEKASSERAIEVNWERIRRYLCEYVRLCRSLKAPLSEDMLEIIAARFSEMLNDNSPAYASDTVITPPSLLPVKALENLWNFLYEWKELHNLLQEVITSLSPLVGALEFAPDEGQVWRIDLGLRLWRQVRIQLRKLESFSRDTKHIGDPFDDTEGTLKGAAWMVEIAPLQNELEEVLHRGDFAYAYNLATELSDICLTYLYKADKHLRDTIEEIYSILGSILRGY